MVQTFKHGILDFNVSLNLRVLSSNQVQKKADKEYIVYLTLANYGK